MCGLIREINLGPKLSNECLVYHIQPANDGAGLKTERVRAVFVCCWKPTQTLPNRLTRQDRLERRRNLGCLRQALDISSALEICRKRRCLFAKCFYLTAIPKQPNRTRSSKTRCTPQHSTLVVNREKSQKAQGTSSDSIIESSKFKHRRPEKRS